jgi:hypothetical protein
MNTESWRANQDGVRIQASAAKAIRVGVSFALKTGLDLFERIHGFQSERFVP